LPTAESPLFASAILAFCSTSLANELLVPSQYSTIQSAIDAAADETPNTNCRKLMRMFVISSEPKASREIY
jgi:hypothetical protein